MLKKFGKKLYGLLPFKQAIFTAVRSIIDLPEPVYRHLHFKGVFQVRIDGAKRFKIRHWGYMIENRLFWKGIDGWEKISLRLWIELARNSQVIFDVGANTGVYSLIAATVNPKAKVFAAEPIARVYRKLVQNIELNGSNITPLNVAISDHDGRALIYDQEGSEHVLAVSMEQGWNEEDIKVIPIEVDVRTITSIVMERDLGRVDLLKIDVEGHEFNVLKGFKNIIERDRPSMILELLVAETARNIESLIDLDGYVFYSIDEKTWPPIQMERLATSSYHNILICVPEVARSIGLSVRSYRDVR